MHRIIKAIARIALVIALSELALAAEPGALAGDKRALTVTCGARTALDVVELQPENRKPVSGTDFANGARLLAGEKFEKIP